VLQGPRVVRGLGSAALVIELDLRFLKRFVSQSLAVVWCATKAESKH